jgi:hypothetical protein
MQSEVQWVGTGSGRDRGRRSGLLEAGCSKPSHIHRLPECHHEVENPEGVLGPKVPKTKTVLKR